MPPRVEHTMPELCQILSEGVTLREILNGYEWSLREKRRLARKAASRRRPGLTDHELGEAGRAAFAASCREATGGGAEDPTPR